MANVQCWMKIHASKSSLSPGVKPMVRKCCRVAFIAGEVERSFLGLVRKITQLFYVLPKNRHVSNQDSQAARRSHYLICISMHKLHLIYLNMNREI